MPSESTSTVPRPEISAPETVPPPAPVSSAWPMPEDPELELLEPPPPQPAITTAPITAISARAYVFLFTSQPPWWNCGGYGGANSRVQRRPPARFAFRSSAKFLGWEVRRG